MRVARYSDGSDPKFGLVELAEDGGEHPDTIATLNGDPLAMAVQFTGERKTLDEVRLLAPVIPRSKVIGVGRNYAAHAAELGNEIPEIPLTFYKPNTSVIGPEEPIIYPAWSREVSYEGELAVVIGRICKEVPAALAQEVIFGYTIGNDMTARDAQASDKQWARAKGFDTSCPLGPWITSHLTVEEAGDLMLTTWVDGVQRQHASTSLMLRKIPELIEYISTYTTLLPGDVILTGTPEGVGLVNPGQEVSIEIEGMGTLRNKIVTAASTGDPSEASDEAEEAGR